LRVTNTRSEEKEPFAVDGDVRMYVCGPTVYGDAHMGHARSYVVFDTVRRYLEYRGFRVRHVQNFTDIEDSITKRAVAAGMDPVAYADARIQAFHRDMETLHVRPADEYPRVTEHIPEIQTVVSELVERGFAYERNGSVYFRASMSEALGSLTHRHPDEMMAGPGGSGDREAEEMIAQAVTGEPWARYWLHNGILQLESEKMSKSLGNSVPLLDVVRKHGADVVRLCILREWYRDTVEHNDRCFEISKEMVDQFRRIYEKAQQAPPPTNGESIRRLVEFTRRSFERAMDDDLDTTDACFVLTRLAEAVEELDGAPAEEWAALRRLLEDLYGILGLFGM
jgi:cysteinyl-tRNA synthetase